MLKNLKLEIVSAFRISPKIGSSSTGTYFKTQSKLTQKNTKLEGLISGNIEYPWGSVIHVIGLNCVID